MHTSHPDRHSGKSRKMESAIVREKAIKEWQRAWKLALIEAMNPQWRDLYDDII